MNEALHFTSRLVALLNQVGAKDRGADYRITVSDTAGTIAEVAWDKERERWYTEGEGFDGSTFLIRSHERDAGHNVCAVCHGNADAAVGAALDELRGRTR